MEDLTICSQVSWLDLFLEQKLQLFTLVSSSSYQARLSSGDGFSVSLPAHLLLASSKLARNTLIPGQDGQDVLLPSVRGVTLLLLVEILRSGKTSNLGTMDNLGHSLNEVQEVMTLLDMQGCVSLMRVDCSELKTKLNSNRLPKYQGRCGEVLAQLSVNLARDEIPPSLNPVVEVTKIKVMANILDSCPSPPELIRDCAQIKVKDEELIGAEMSGSEGLPDGVKASVLPRECHICRKKYMRKDSLKSHIYTMHRESMLPCEHCDKKFILESNLKKHVTRSHQENRVSCEYCKRTYMNKEVWREHMRKNHKNELISCLECDMHFFRDATLRIHVKNAHTGTPFQCGECPAKFSKKAKVQDHMRNVHSGILFVCEQCRSTFSSKPTLNRHMKTVHKHSGDMCGEQLVKDGDRIKDTGECPSTDIEVQSERQ